MAWCASEDEICQAMERQWGKDPEADGNGPETAPQPDAQLPTPSQLGIKSGILSDVPLHLRVPPTDWSNMDLGLSKTDLASLAGGLSGYHLGGSGSGGFSPASNIASMGGASLPNATQVYSALQTSPINLNAEVPAPPPSLEDAARSAQFNMTDQDLARIRDYTDARLRDQAVMRELASIASATLSPQIGVPKIAAETAAKAIDALNGISEANAEFVQDKAFQDELWRTMNNRIGQSAMA